MNPLAKILVSVAVLVGLLYLSAIIFREIGFFFSNLLWLVRNNLLVILAVAVLVVAVGGYFNRRA
jgi:hypothetical protein